MLRLLGWLLLAALALTAYRSCSRLSGTDPVWAKPSPNGFIHAAMPEGSHKNTVLILAPINCPSDAAQRADRLATELERQGVPVKRSDFYNSSVPEPSQLEKENIDRAVSVLNGTPPAVFVNGMGKSNPTVEQVVAEYELTRH